MDLHKIILELQAEKQRLDEAILALERLSNGGSHRRGRPSRRLEEGDLLENTMAPDSSSSAQSHSDNG